MINSSTKLPLIVRARKIFTSKTGIGNPHMVSKTQLLPSPSTTVSSALFSKHLRMDIKESEADNDVGTDDADGDAGAKPKSRRELPAGAVATLKAWLLSPEHFTHPYPTPQDQIALMEKTGIDKKQLKNWFTNARRRIWKPMLKKQLEQTVSAPGGPTMLKGVGVTLPGAVSTGKDAQLISGGILNPMIQAQFQAMQNLANLNNAIGGQVNAVNYSSLVGMNQSNVSAPQAASPASLPPPPQPINNAKAVTTPMATSNSIGSLPPINANQSPNISKTDSHAVLMELFTRDQDLVRQAHEGARARAEGGMAPVAKRSVPNTNSVGSWPHFSSVSSLNNLGGMTGVKSITNMSMNDLAAQGNLNKNGNLANVKSTESMGRADSFAFLEVFFDANGQNITSRGVKREREEDNDIGLSLDADESPSTQNGVSQSLGISTGPAAGTLHDGKDEDTSESDTLKRAYDDALAARGLMSVSRSCERLSDLSLPPKMQRSLSQDLIRRAQLGSSQHFMPYPCFISSSCTFPGQVSDLKPQQESLQKKQKSEMVANTASDVVSVPISDPSMNSASIEVPTTTTCCLCGNINVDTQLRPCGHMFHGPCLKPSLQNAVGPPCCPIDNIPMLSAVLAIPTDNVSNCREYF
uniref:Homeobox domain-containing protein n=1 Tax=Corethron hystrix TaxID=216773 RepID=A0A7S1BZB4_9STRA|mmetsp:Transcript_6139/g.13253  ORF Transcript_6139/g.13253 Transcript_6139/m.13253 type:complete len:637 (+) Transcript_6139:693-2603(+)